MGAPRYDRGGGERRRRAVFATLIALALVSLQSLPAAADPGDQQQLEQLNKQKQELERAVQVSRQNAERYRQEANRFQSAVNAATARIAQLAAEQRSAQSQADQLKLDIQIAEEQLSLVGFQLEETQALIDSLNAQNAAQERQLKQREAVYAVHLKTAYRQAMISPLEMLLSSASLSDFIERVQALIFVARQDRQMVNDIRAIKSQTAQNQVYVAQKQDEIEGLKAQITGQREALARKKAEYEDIVAAKAASRQEQGVLATQAAQNRNGAIAAQQQANREAAELNRRIEQVEAKLAELAARLAAESGLAVFTGRMNFWPLNGVITSPFGPRWGSFHNGIDIAAPMYTPVRAAAPGRVVTVGKPYLAYGDTATVIIIAHGSNFSTLYGHLNDEKPPVVKVGQFVTAGQIIAYNGSTGWSTGPHVHFMTIVNGQAVNPMPYMPPR